MAQARATAKSPQTIDLKEQLSFAIQIATGMVALAKQRIVHRDLAAFGAWLWSLRSSGVLQAQRAADLEARVQDLGLWTGSRRVRGQFVEPCCRVCAFQPLQ